eukprot:CAMPEP_0113459510 /NCGR_PEP_ID=MMETSP0014_2-20120614/10490_1 /TAXON_ID=2857 /ORGANISM="Nitzschia sp." /LENGTH=550 /DNA_ID=CAMNT_0000351097 /DNA_START=214 /DNA_END=1866 /DNA_ORIENTATION=+ /assembly_acc=CAM_ASM_000159
MGGNNDSESDSRRSSIANLGNDRNDDKKEVQLPRKHNSSSRSSSSSKSKNVPVVSSGSTTSSKSTAAAAAKGTAKSAAAAKPKTKPKWKPSTKRFKKAPGAPKRFRSAFILFSQQKHKEIQEELALSKKKKTTDGDGDGDGDGDVSDEKLTTTSVAKLVSEAWRNLNAEDRAKWDAKATVDRERYEKEKLAYNGPWSVPIGHRRSKDPSAPKRPASAFLSFSNQRRAECKRQHQDASNADISRLLSKMWKEAPEDVRKKYQDDEAKARQEYKKRIAEWRIEDKKTKEAKKKDPLEVYEETGRVGAYGLPTPKATPAKIKRGTKSSRKKRANPKAPIDDQSRVKRIRESPSMGVHTKAGATTREAGMGEVTSFPIGIGGISGGFGASNIGLQAMMGIGSPMDHRPIGMMAQNVGLSDFTHGLTTEQQLMLLRGTMAPNAASMNFHNVGQSTTPFQLQGFSGSINTNQQQGTFGSQQQSFLQNQLSQLSNLELMRLAQQQQQQQSLNRGGVGGGIQSGAYGGNANIFAPQQGGSNQFGYPYDPSSRNHPPNT